MKKSIGFSVAAIILTTLYGMLCVGIFTNTGLVYNLYGVVIQDWHADASVYISLYVQTFLNAALVLLFAVGALLGNSGTENNTKELILLVFAVIFQCLLPVCNTLGGSYETVVIARRYGAASLAAYSAMKNLLGLAGILLTIANAMALLQIGINYGRKKKNQ